MNRTRTVIAGATIVALGLVSLNGIAVAATGHGLILGKVNSASSTTTISRSGNGPALSLLTKSSQPPLTVSSSKLVKHLNADAVDGLHASSLQTSVLRYTLPATIAGTGFDFALDNVPKGVYEASYNVYADMTLTGATLNCYFVRYIGATSAAFELGYGSSYLHYSTANASGVLDLRSATVLRLHCFSDNSFAINPAAYTSSVTLVHFDRLTGRTAGAPA